MMRKIISDLELEIEDEIPKDKKHVKHFSWFDAKDLDLRSVFSSM